MSVQDDTPNAPQAGALITFTGRMMIVMACAFTVLAFQVNRRDLLLGVIMCWPFVMPLAAPAGRRLRGLAAGVTLTALCIGLLAIARYVYGPHFLELLL